MDLLRPTFSFSVKNYLDIIKTKGATNAFFFSSSFPLASLFLLSFSIVKVMLDLIAVKKPAF